MGNKAEAKEKVTKMLTQGLGINVMEKMALLRS
jgi:hypothetical protein